jgi:outer membrane protein TolC
MDLKHEPRDEFIDRLEGRISAEARRRQRVEAPAWTRWMPQRPLQAAIAVLALVVVSMLVGGAVVAAAYQAQTAGRRDALVSAYQGKVQVAQQLLNVTKLQLQTAQQRFSVGTGDQNALLEAEFKVKEAQAQLVSSQLQLAEVQLTGLEPLNQISAPLVSGRDFVSERLHIEMSIPAAALDWEKTLLADVQRRVAVGAANTSELDVARSRVTEIQAAVEAFQRKIEIRRRFLNKDLDATLADLRVLEAEAQQRRSALAPKLDLARKQAKDMATRVEIGTASAVELAEAQLRVKQLELDLFRAEMDLAVIGQKIKQHKIDG